MIFQVQSKEIIPEVANHSKCHPIATENGFLLTVQHSSIMLWTDSCQAVLNTKHRLPVTALCVSAATHPYMCSCSDDKVIIWNIDDFYKNNTDDDTKPNAGLLVGIDLGAITDCAISCNNTWLALCRNSDVWVVGLQHVNGVLTAVSHHATLEPAGESPSSCCFSPDVPNLLITADDTNTFKVWNAEDSRMIQRSAVGAWHHISFCEFVPHGSHRGHLLVGTNRGALHLFSVDLKTPPRDLGQVSARPPVHSAVVIVPEPQDLVSENNNGKSLPPAGNYECCLPSTPPECPDDGSEAGCVVLGALLVDADLMTPTAESPESPDSLEALRPDEDDPTVDAILAPAPLLVVCSNLGIAVYDCHSWDCLAFHHYTELLAEQLSLVSAAALDGRSAGHVRCLLSGWAPSAGHRRGPGPRAHLVSIACRASQRPRQPLISFLSLKTPSARSPLRAQFSRPAVDSATAAYGARSGAGAGAGASSRARPRKSGPLGAPGAPQPRPVKSSGYGTMEQRQRFVPVINRPRVPVRDKASAGRPAAAAGGGGLLSRVDGESMSSWTPPLQQSGKVSLWNDFGTTVQLASSGDGLSLACSCGPGVLSVLRWSRPSVDDCVRIAGHDARISSVCFSADSAWLMSASSDGRTKVWDWRDRRCVLDIDGGPSPGGGGAARRGGATRAGVGRGHAVTKAAFYYLDRFILRAVSNVVELYCHRLHDQPDVLPAAAKSGLGGGCGWRRVRAVKFPTQQVTCFTAPNNFYSNVLVAGCASRSLHVYDVDAERFLAEVRDAHPRPPHVLVPASPSSAAPHGARAADLLVSAAVCDGAKLWDLRQARCVQKFTRHLNRAHTCGVSFSPCCRFLAVGSEDKCVYLYDTRKSNEYVDKLMGLNEVVLDVTWNSNIPQLAASALNSCVAVYDVHK